MNSMPMLQAQIALDLAHARAAEQRAEADQHRLALQLARQGRLAAFAAALDGARAALIRPARGHTTLSV